MKHLDKPDTETWRRRKATVERFQKTWRDRALEAEELYELRWAMDGIPDGIPITMPSTARAIIDEATDHSDFDPRWQRIFTPTYGLHEDAAKNSSALRGFFPGWLYYQTIYNNDVSPIRDFIKNLYLYGKAVFKTYYDKEEWHFAGDDESVKRNREMIVPIAMRSIHPTACFEDPSLGEKKWNIEVYKYHMLEVMGLYDNWTPEELDVDDALDAPDISVWDCYQIGEDAGVTGLWHQVLVDEGETTEGSSIVSEATEAVFLPNEPFPYDFRFSGMGRQSGGKYDEKARGLLFAVMSLLKAEGRRLTQLDAIVSAFAWPTLFVTGPRTRFRVAYGPNMVNYIPQGVQVTTVTPTIPQGPIQASLATLQAGIERGTFGSVIRGDKPANTTSAAQLAILSGQARLRFGSPKIHMEATLAKVYNKVGIIIKDVIKEPVTILQTNDTAETNPAKLVLSPSQIPDPMIVRVQVLSDPVEEQERAAQLGVFLFEHKIIDWEEAAERAGVQDIAEMRRRMIRDAVLFNNPAVLQPLGERYLLESGYDLATLTLEKTMRDLMILRAQSEAQNAILGGQAGANTAGSEPSPAGFQPQQTGGRPPPPTGGSATASGRASA